MLAIYIYIYRPSFEKTILHFPERAYRKYKVALKRSKLVLEFGKGEKLSFLKKSNSNFTKQFNTKFANNSAERALHWPFSLQRRIIDRLRRTIHLQNSSKLKGKQMDKVGRIVYTKLRPFHFESLSDAKSPTDNPSQTESPSVQCEYGHQCIYFYMYLFYLFSHSQNLIQHEQKFVNQIIKLM